jgi:outer membrane translocation and assembly module TamA
MNFTNITQDLEDIKKSLKDNFKTEYLIQPIEGIAKQSDIENIVTNIVQTLLSELKFDMKKEINKQILAISWYIVMSMSVGHIGVLLLTLFYVYKYSI